MASDRSFPARKLTDAEKLRKIPAVTVGRAPHRFRRRVRRGGRPCARVRAEPAAAREWTGATPAARGTGDDRGNRRPSARRRHRVHPGTDERRRFFPRRGLSSGRSTRRRVGRRRDAGSRRVARRSSPIRPPTVGRGAFRGRHRPVAGTVDERTSARSAPGTDCPAAAGAGVTRTPARLPPPFHPSRVGVAAATGAAGRRPGDPTPLRRRWFARSRGGRPRRAGADRDLAVLPVLERTAALLRPRSGPSEPSRESGGSRGSAKKKRR